MPNVTLADIQEAADRKYGPFVIDMGDGQTCTLLNALRLDKDRRKQVMALQNKINTAQEKTKEDPEAEQGSGAEGSESKAKAAPKRKAKAPAEDEITEENIDEFLIEMIRLVAKSKDDAERLLRAVGDDLGILMGIIEGYSEASELGEASDSES